MAAWPIESQKKPDAKESLRAFFRQGRMGRNAPIGRRKRRRTRRRRSGRIAMINGAPTGFQGDDWRTAVTSRRLMKLFSIGKVIMLNCEQALLYFN
jgi:hypothetical protein